MKKLLLLTAILMSTAFAFAQERMVSGVVSDANGEPLPGVSILIKGTTSGTSTNIDGKYNLSLTEEANTLIFKLIGFSAQEINIGNQSVISVTLQEDIEQLEEVVVTALGVQRNERAIGYAVQKVDGASIAQSKETNIVNALNGQIAGVQVQGTTNAGLGSSSRILIRGVNSFTGENQPLFVVDGVPMDNSNFATSDQMEGFGDGAYDYGNTAQDINPNDIASMSVLKGAAATAIYGSRGANGVILITMKSGKEQKKGLGVAVNSGVTFERATNLLPHQQIYGGGAAYDTPTGFKTFKEGEKEFLAPAYGKDGSWGPKYDENILVRHWDSFDPNNPDTYQEVRPWVAPENDYSTFFETGVNVTSSIALTGANENGNFRLSFSNTDQTSILPNSGLDKYSFSLNTTYKLSDKLTASAMGNFTSQEIYGRSATGYDNNNVMQGFTQWWQTQLDFDRLQNYKMVDGRQQTWNLAGPVEQADGSYVVDHSPVYFDNPYWVRYENIQNDRRDRFFGNAQLNYQIIEGLSANARIGYDGYTWKMNDSRANGGVDLASHKEEIHTHRETNLEGRIAYDKRFNEFTVSAIAGGNIMRQVKHRNTINTTSGLAIDEYYNIANSTGIKNVETDDSKYGINSVFTTASFGYKDMVFVDASYRQDWSSTLPKGSNSYGYPGITTSFVVSELPVFQTLDWLSFAKVRAGYGEASNDPGLYRLVDVYNASNLNFGSDPRYAVPNRSNNPVLKPETTKEIEFGVDLRFFNGRLGLDVAYFDRSTVDQLINVSSSAATGYTEQLLNAGEMRNSGVELMLTARAVETKDFAWDIMFNVSKLNNEVVSFTEGLESIPYGSTWAASLSIEKGLPYMAIMGQDYTYDNNGNRIVGANGRYVYTEEQVYLGSTLADWTGGIRNQISWKGFTAGAMVDFQFGGAMHSTSLQWLKYSGMAPITAENNVRENGIILDGVKEGTDGEENDIVISAQSFYQGDWRKGIENYYDASFVKLREVSLGYTIPNSLIARYGIRDLNISFVGRNLGLLYSEVPYLDPQAVTGTANNVGLENAQVPSTQSYGFNLSFKL